MKRSTPEQNSRLLAQVIERMSLESDFEKMCQFATQVTLEVLGAQLSALALPDVQDATRGLRFRFFSGFPPEIDTQTLPGITPGTAAAFKSGQCVFVPDYLNYAGAMPAYVKAGVRSGFAAPIRLGESVVGVLTLAWTQTTEKPSAEETQLVEAVLRQVGFAYQRDQLLAELVRHRDHLQELVREQTADLLAAKEAAENAMREAKKAEEHARYLALNDALTGLPNRLLLQERLQQAMSHSQREGKKLAVLFIDLDRFKNVNDSLGHSIGDLLLREVGRRLASGVRHTDTVSRQGGDEFIILLSHIDDINTVSSVADNLLRVVSQPYAIDKHELSVTHSIGISIYPNDGANMEDLMRKADAAMYRAKDLGRNNFQFYAEDLQ